jgi:hypothetical protein
MKAATLLIFLLILPIATAAIDASICTKDFAAADAAVQACVDSCAGESTQYAEAYNLKRAELAGILDDPIANCEGYAGCVASCKAQTAGLEDPEMNIAQVMGLAASCLQATCPEAIAACEQRKVQLQTEVNNHLYYSYKCVCEECLLPGCRYFDFEWCTEAVSTCDEARKAAFNAGYPVSKKAWIGCNSSAAAAGLAQNAATAGLKGSTVTPTTKIEAATSVSPSTKPTTSSIKQASAIQQQNEAKLQVIAKQGQALEVQTKTGKKQLVVPDNSKLDLVDKTYYQKKKQFEGDIIDNTFGNIPGVGLWKDYVKKFYDDTKTDDEKIKQTQTDLDLGANAAKQFNEMDGTGDKELSLSAPKNAIPSTPLTKPYEFIFTQLGNGVKKTMAHGYNSEYNSVLEQAKELRQAGSSWTETIKQTTKLVGEETEGKRWVQTLNALSKADYKTQAARINAYILQQKENGELQ